MAMRDIVLDGNPTLRKVCRPVEVFDEKLGKLIDDMRETMAGNEGAGLAAPQVGILRRVAVVDADGLYLELVNPVIIEQSGSQIGSEACLSVPDKQAVVDRPYRVVVAYRDRFGKRRKTTAEGFAARACCHEIDHLDGILYYDKTYKEKKD